MDEAAAPQGSAPGGRRTGDVRADAGVVDVGIVGIGARQKRGILEVSGCGAGISLLACYGRDTTMTELRTRMCAAGHKLGVVMRKVFGVGTPRTLQAEGEADLAVFLPRIRLLRRLVRACERVVALMAETSAIDVAEFRRWHIAAAPALAA